MGEFELWRCTSCGAPIRWVVTKRGRRMPLDPDQNSERGNVKPCTVGGETVWAVLAGNELASARANHEELYVSHFATCPNAAAHRTK